MPDDKDVMISAQVILRSGSGRRVTPDVLITSENLAEFAPAAATVTASMALFQAAGFDVGPMVGVSFTVTGTVRSFEDFFGMRVRMRGDGAHEFVADSETIGPELSQGYLPRSTRNLVAAVVFPVPAELFP